MIVDGIQSSDARVLGGHVDDSADFIGQLFGVRQPPPEPQTGRDEVVVILSSTSDGADAIADQRDEAEWEVEDAKRDAVFAILSFSHDRGDMEEVPERDEAKGYGWPKQEIPPRPDGVREPRHLDGEEAKDQTEKHRRILLSRAPSEENH